jgi:hypothetical protein
VQDCLGCPDHFRGRSQLRPCIEVAIVVGEVAARDLDPDLISSRKQIARRPKIDCVFVDLVWFDGNSLFQRLPRACPNDTVAEIVGLPVWMDIDQFRVKIGIGRR